MITKVKALHEDARLPTYGYDGDAGMDLSVVGSHTLNPGESRDLPTGIAVELPEGFWARITGRSSTLRKRGLFVNEGVIDEGYRGELLVYVTNRQSTPVEIAPGDRLAQLILHPVHQAPAEWAVELSESDRGTNGFGSTDRKSIDAATMQEWDAARAAIVTEPTILSGTVYLGGAVDVAEGLDTHYWRHDGWTVLTYCPICMCKGMTADSEIIKRNTRALDMATDAVFVLDAFSVGTPIEAWHRIIIRRKPAVIVWPRLIRSVFVGYMGGQPGVEVVPSIDEAKRRVRERVRESNRKLTSRLDRATSV